MGNPPLKPILDATFRANPAYELVVFDALTAEQQAMLHDLQKDPTFYGILRPRESVTLSLKGVCRDTALLFFTLNQPQRIPAYVRAMYGDTCNQAITELVLDSVLEIEDGSGFVHGAQAYAAIYEPIEALTPQSRIAQLSYEALLYAQALDIDDVTKLSARMYFHNRLPISPFWKRQLPTADAVATYLGIHRDGAHRRTLDQYWSRVPLSPPNDGWLMWRPRQTRRDGHRRRSPYKLYISPAMDSLPAAFAATLDVLTDLQTAHFKIGRDLYGLLRPDKLVVYCETFQEIEQVTAGLVPRLADCTAHGVPFTSELAGAGMLSWGMDPPADQQVLSWQERESWRLWITNRLAAALLAAKHAPSSDVPPWLFALERLRLEGVDTESWTPAHTLWTANLMAEA